MIFLLGLCSSTYPPSEAWFTTKIEFVLIPEIILFGRLLCLFWAPFKFSSLHKVGTVGCQCQSRPVVLIFDKSGWSSLWENMIYRKEEWRPPLMNCLKVLSFLQFTVAAFGTGIAHSLTHHWNDYFYPPTTNHQTPR